MRVLACVKRVPMVGGRIVLSADGREIDTRMSGFTVSPHEECAVEEAVRLTEQLGGSVTVLTLGPPEAADQLRDMLAQGAGHAVLLETDGAPWGPVATAAAIAAIAGEAGGGGGSAAGGSAAGGYDLLLFGNEAADTGDYQVPVRVAHALGLPCVTGIRKLEIIIGGGRAVARRDYRGAEEVFELPLPAVISVKEGINLPRYPSLPGRLRARRAQIERRPAERHPPERDRPERDRPERQEEGLRTQRLRLPESGRRGARILGAGPDAVPALVALLGQLGLLDRLGAPS